MSNQDTTHQLIQTMSRTEKAYFKKYARKQQREKDDFYFKLFDAIDQQETYNSALLLKKFRKRKMTQKQLSIAKHYLYNLLLTSLLAYQKNKSIDAQLHEQIETIQLLTKRSLLTQALKTLHKAQKLAQKHEAFLHLLLLQMQEEEILRLQMTPELQRYIECGFEQEIQITKQWLNLRHYRYLATKSNYWSRQQYTSRTDASDQITNTILEDVQQSAPPLSAKAKFLQLHTCIDYYNQKGNFQVSSKLLKEQITLLEAHPLFLELNQIAYIIILNNLGVNQRHLQDFQGLLTTAQKLKAITPKNPHETIQIFESWAQTMLIYITYSKSKVNHSKDLKNIEDEFEIYKDKIGYDFKIIIPYGLACSYFWQNQYHRALDWLNRTQVYYTKNIIPDLKIAARLIELIIHYELDHQYYLLNANESTYRFLMYNKRLYKLEANVIKRLRQLSAQITSSQKTKEIFKAFKADLIELQKDPMEVGAFQLFDFIRWTDDNIK
ncbi:hypothetical protein [Aureispira sp. CCB-QB1]|uniref:hypothetical protein n=1 Tax=Aureispira sp. CCB-QB1 TaxID=1313421 RepID=UPI000698B792|nr:hypothetical protein [Aureispira sp. CCB-QB1]